VVRQRHTQPRRGNVLTQGLALVVRTQVHGSLLVDCGGRDAHNAAPNDTVSCQQEDGSGAFCTGISGRMKETSVRVEGGRMTAGGRGWRFSYVSVPMVLLNVMGVDT
jgi:hypothetical protein